MKGAAAEAAGHGLRRPAVPDAGGAGVHGQHRGGVLAHRKPLSGAGPAGGSVRGAGVGLLVAVRQALLYGPPPFSATLEELGRDAELLERVRDAHDEDPRRRGGLSHGQAFSSIDRAVRIELRARRHRARIPGPGHRQRRPQAGAGLASRACCPDWRQQCVTLAWQAIGLARRYPLVSSSLSAMFMWRQALSPAEGRGGRAGGLAAVENLAGSKRQGSGRALRFGVLIRRLPRTPSWKQDGVLFAGRWTVAAWRASRIGQPCA